MSDFMNSVGPTEYIVLANKSSYELPMGYVCARPLLPASYTITALFFFFSK